MGPSKPPTGSRGPAGSLPRPLGPRLFLFMLFAVLVPLAVPAQTTYWEFFQAGKKANEEARYPAAAEALQQAIALRPGSAKRVRLYGTNFVDGYFPHTELAYAYLKLGRTRDAQRELEGALAAGVEPQDRIKVLLKSARNAEAAGGAPSGEGSSQAASHEPAPSTAAPPAGEGSAKGPSGTPSASVVFWSTPEGATVSLDGRTLGASPLTLDPAAEGPHRVRFEHPGYSPAERAFVVRPGDKLTVPAELLPLKESAPAAPSASSQPLTGDLALEVRPPGASVVLDGISRGTAGTEPLLLSGLSPGDHRVELHLSGYSDKTFVVHIQAGVQVHFETDLSPASDRAGAVGSLRPQAKVSAWLAATFGASGLLAALAVLLLRRYGWIPWLPAWLGARRGSSSEPSPAGLDIPSGRLGPYVIERKLGSGGMGDVYLATDERSGRQVALKVPQPRLVDDEGFASRFIREGTIGQQLIHEGILRIFETGQTEGRLFIAMEVAEGESLKAFLAGLEAPLPSQEAVRIAREVAMILHYTHAQGIIHRDLKPDNIMILRGSRHVKVADFGVAKLSDATSFTVTGQIFGTPNYLPPEPLIGEPYGASSDLYSLGVILFEMLTLKRPFEADTIMETFRKHQLADRPLPSSLNPDVPRALDAIVLKLLQIKPGDRYTTASDLVAALDAAMAQIHPFDPCSSARPKVPEPSVQNA